MKKITATVLALLMLAAAFTGCTKKADDDVKDNDTNIETPADDKKDENEKADEDKTDDDSKSDEDEKKDDTEQDNDKPAVNPSESDKDDKKGNEIKDNKPSENPSKPDDQPSEKPSQSDQQPSQEQTESTLSGKSLSEIIDMIYEKNPVEDLSLVTDMLSTDDADMLKYIAGITDASLVSEVAYSGPMIGSIPYSMVLARVKDKKDTATVAQQMKDNINMRRWVCVEADSLTVDGYDDVVMLFMVNEENYGDIVTADGMKEAFKAVCGGSLDVEL